MAAAGVDTAIREASQEAGGTADDSQFLTFVLGEELYGVDILRVQEIKPSPQSGGFLLQAQDVG